MTNILQFPKRSLVSTITIDIETTILENREIWYRLTDVKTGEWCDWVKLESAEMTDKCSCRARDKAKCSKENGPGCGKMCLKEVKEDNKAFDELTEKLWKEHPEEMVDAQAWAKNFIEKWKEDPGLVIVGDWFIDETVGVDWKTFIGDKDDHRNDH